MKKPLTILGVLANVERAGGCEAYRVMYPLRALEMAGCTIAVAKAAEIDAMFRRGKNPLANVDVMIFQRIVARSKDEVPQLTRATYALRAAGIAAVMDYDDDYSNEHRKVHDGVLPDLKAYSAVSVSTNELRDKIKPMTSRVLVHPNGIVPDLFDGKRFHRFIPGLSIGLTGSATHKEDWKPAVEAVKSVLQKRPELTVFVSGYTPPELKDVPGVRLMRDFIPGANRDDFFVDLESYGGIHANIDILLCPVDPRDGFNRYKSNLKAIEGMASARGIAGKTGGSCVIATGGDLPIYKNAVIHGETGLLVDDHHDPAAWEEAILKVVSNVELRNKLQIAGYQHCMKHFTVHKLAQERLAAYRRLAYEAKRDSGKYMAELALLETIQ